MKYLTFLLLIIYTFFGTGITAQNLQLKIKGKNDTETRVIDSLSYTKIHKDYSSISSEIDLIRKRIYQTGYIENRLIKNEKANDSSFVFTFNLNHKYDSIHIYYDNEPGLYEILTEVSHHVLDDHFILPFNSVEESLNYINSKIAASGFPFSSLQLESIQITGPKTVKANLVINNTKKRTIDGIVVKGYEKFSKSYIKHFLKIKPGTEFNLDLIKKKTALLDNLNFATQIKEPEVLFTKDSTTLYLYVRKTRSNAFDGFLGFGTNEETNNIDFNGYLNLQLNNNLNYGESLSLKYKSDENEQRNFNIKINLPYLIGTPIGTEFELNIFRKDSSFTTVDQAAKIFYQIDSKNTLFVGINGKQSNNLLDDTNNVNSISDYKSTIYSVRFNHIVRQKSNRLFPTNFLLDVEAGIGSRRFTDNSETQSSLSLNAFKIFKLNRKNSAYIRLNGAGLFSDSFFENELYRFGGINSIRGFEENSLTASAYGLINTEYRYQLSRSIYVHSIIDFSYLENELSDQKEKLYGFGFGFGILTRAGLLKFNYANGKNENQNFKLSNSKIHLSLTAFF